MVRKIILSGILSVLLVAGLLVTVRSFAIGNGESANGHGTLLRQDENGKTVRRQFSFSAQRRADGSVKGQATLHNPAFDGANGQNYQAKIDISCMRVYGNRAVMSGFTRRTNDPNLLDVATFIVEDNGEPGRNNDKISGVAFFDGDPNTTGDPQACEVTPPDALPLETIEAGNIQVRP
jgi:hypothetical protein